MNKNKLFCRLGGLLMGGVTCFVYVFAALAPFIAMNMMHMDVSLYGTTNLLPSIGLILGSLISAKISKIMKQVSIIRLGILITLIGSIVMLAFILLKCAAVLSLFIPMMICYFGLAFVFANASTLALSHTTDKAHGSAVMNFINMGMVTVIVLSLGEVAITPLLLPGIYIAICLLMVGLNKLTFSRM